MEEADGDGTITAKNVYGGPLLYRTTFDAKGVEKETYSYLYNVHGDVVTLLSDGAVTATYVYDAFGNITEQTGEADNSILYAGYQYDEETGLYYLNARMYDPVTARFLQADTYLGNQADPLSLNLYTYCLNNPERYIDPSGHFALELAAILVTAIVLGMTIDIAIQKFVEQKVCIDLDRTITEGLFSGVVALFTFGAGLAVNTVGRTAASGIKAAGTVRTIANALISSAVFGATTEAAQDMAHLYFIEGRSLSQIDYRRVGISAALGTVISAGSTMVGAGINQLRAVRTGAHTTQLVGDVMQGGVPIEHNILQRPRMLKLNLQFFASKADDGVGRTVGDVVESGKISVGRMDLAGKKHPVSGVEFDSNGFPIFESKYNTKLDPRDYMMSRGTHFDRASKALYNDIVNNSNLKSEFTEAEIAIFKEGGVPKAYTWHHHQDEGIMQLVNRKIHRQTGHAGGFSIWGPGN